MRIATLVSAVLLLMIAACKKEETKTNTSDPDPITTTTNTGPNPYYFKFKFRGADYTLASAQPGYLYYGNINEAGGSIDTLSTNLNLHFPSIGIEFKWPTGHKVTEAELLALKGKTLSFINTSPQVNITLTRSDIEPYWFSDVLVNTKYYVKIDNITFLKNDVAYSNSIKVYVITGTCVASMSKYTTDIDNSGELTNGQFNFRISMRE